MPDGSIQQMQPVLQARGPETAVRGIVQFCAAAPVLDIDLIDIMHEFKRSVFPDMLVERAAEFICNIVFTVRKCASSFCIFVPG